MLATPTACRSHALAVVLWTDEPHTIMDRADAFTLALWLSPHTRMHNETGHLCIALF